MIVCQIADLGSLADLIRVFGDEFAARIVNKDHYFIVRDLLDALSIAVVKILTDRNTVRDHFDLSILRVVGERLSICIDGRIARDVKGVTDEPIRCGIDLRIANRFCAPLRYRRRIRNIKTPIAVSVERERLTARIPPSVTLC